MKIRNLIFSMVQAPVWIAVTALEIQGEIIQVVFQQYHWICQPELRFKSLSGTVT